MKSAMVPYTHAMSRPSVTSELTPKVPTVYAIAPKAPIGATTITRLTMRKNTCISRSSIRATGRPARPSEARAAPNRTEKKTTCRISPWANAPTTLDGTMWVMKSTKRSCSPWVANWLTSPVARREASIPSPGRTRFTTTRPIARANVVTISK